VHSLTISAWCRGRHTPSLLNIKPLGRMEKLFKISEGTLVSKISGWRCGRRFRLSELPPFLQQEPKLFHQIRCHLPDNFSILPLERQKQIVESIHRDILRGNDDYTQRLMILCRLPYRLKEWPGLLRAEVDSLAHFKMDQRPPLGMRRNGIWRPASKEKFEDSIAYFYGALCLPTDASDVRIRGLGLTVTESQLTLALICCPKLVDWYIRFRCEARSQYTSYATGLLKTFISILRRETGWLRQSPHLAARLRPFVVDDIHYVPQDLVSRAQTDWHGVCA
jgi:hypothetical protein